MPTLAELRSSKDQIEQSIITLKTGIQKNLNEGNFNVDNMCAMQIGLEKDLKIINAQIKAMDPANCEVENESDRKAYGISAGPGVNIRPRNDDPSKYTTRKRKTYKQILEEAKKTAVKN